ncbi:MAG: PD-(D/E)XK nuclease domain-containing protein [Porcipelethomonas sp.]
MKIHSLAYYSAGKNYTVERELPAGKGFADLVFKPRKNRQIPALIVELKYDSSAESAIEQIKNKQYTDCLKDYSGEILLVGINYDKDSKKHFCFSLIILGDTVVWIVSKVSLWQSLNIF